MTAAEVVVAVNPAQVLAHRCHALDADEDVDLAVGICLHHFVIGMDNPERLALGDLRLCRSHDLLGALDIVHVIRGVNPDDEDAAFHLTGTKPVQMVIL